MQVIVARPAIQIILACTTKQPIISALTENHIVADVPNHIVCQGISQEPNVPVADHCCGIDQIIGDHRVGNIGAIITQSAMKRGRRCNRRRNCARGKLDCLDIRKRRDTKRGRDYGFQPDCLDDCLIPLKPENKCIIARATKNDIETA